MFNFFRKKAKPKLYSSCDELPIHNFNKAMNGDYNYLKVNKEEQVKETDLEAVWLSILDEFLRLSKNTIALSKIAKKSKVINLENRLYVLQVLYYCVERKINVEKELVQYKTSKEKVSLHISMLKNEINQMSPKDAEEELNNSSDFENSIALLIKNGCRIDRFTTVVSEWCSLLNIMEKQKNN